MRIFHGGHCASALNPREETGIYQLFLLFLTHFRQSRKSGISSILNIMSRCARLLSLVFLFASPHESRGISTFRGWKPNSFWSCGSNIFSFNFFIFSSSLWVVIISLTEAWCARMGIITLFGMVCVE